MHTHTHRAFNDEEREHAPRGRARQAHVLDGHHRTFEVEGQVTPAVVAEVFVEVGCVCVCVCSCVVVGGENVKGVYLRSVKWCGAAYE
jgi:hypothetical protein